MFRNPVLKIAAVFVGAIALISAQTANPKAPQPKSQKELEALQAMFGAYQAQNVDGTIEAAKNLITKFADSDFKATAFMMAAESYRQKNDVENAVVQAELALQADPKYYAAMVLIAGITAQRTREFDLDKEEKLAKAEKTAKEALEIIQTAPKLNPGITDEQWEGAKKGYASQAYEALGMAAMVRKNYEACATNLNSALDTPMPDPSTYVRLGNCLRMLKKYDEALAVLDKALADPNSVPAIKQAATNEKMEVNKAKMAK